MDFPLFLKVGSGRRAFLPQWSSTVR